MNDKSHTAQAEALTFTDKAVQQCPFPAYDTLRDSAPVYRDPVTGHYLVTRYTDVRKMVLNQKQLSSDNGLVSNRNSDKQEEINAIYMTSGYIPAPAISNYDPPVHKLHRAPLDRAFNHWNVKALEAEITDLADSFIDEFIDRGEVEFCSAFALKLPMFVIAGQLGVDPGRMADFKRWSDARVAIIDPNISADVEVEKAKHIAEMYAYFVEQIDRVRTRPDETLLSKIAHVTNDNGDPLDIPELLSLMESLLVAGNETTAFAIGTSMKLLIENPEIANELRRHPEKIGAFIEESLRVRSPLQTHFRKTKEDVVISGTTVPEGAIIELRYGAANRDGATFECPEQVRLDRENGTAHLAFGAGIHICIGMQLARAELRIAVERLLARMDNIRLAQTADPVALTPMYISCGVVHLDICFDKIAG